MGPGCHWTGQAVLLSGGRIVTVWIHTDSSPWERILLSYFSWLLDASVSLAHALLSPSWKQTTG